MTNKQEEDRILHTEGRPTGPATTTQAGLNLYLRIRNLEEWINKENKQYLKDHIKNLQLYKQYWDSSPAEVIVAVRLLED